jgi:hypothetical protein
MKLDGVDTWLHHWLKLQKKNKRALFLKDGMDKSGENNLILRIVSKRKGKKKGRHAASDSDDLSHPDGEADGGSNADADDDGGLNESAGATETNMTNNGAGENTAALLMLPSPRSASTSWSSRRTFLASLSEEANYRKLLLLLHVAKVSRTIVSTYKT